MMDDTGDKLNKLSSTKLEAEIVMMESVRESNVLLCLLKNGRLVEIDLSKKPDHRVKLIKCSNVYIGI